MAPSERVVVPRLFATAPVPAVALPFVISGGQSLAHSPEQALLPFLSFSNRYSVRPWASTRIRPRSVLRTATVLAGAVFATVVDAGVAVELAFVPLDPPPHPATANTAAIETGKRRRERFIGELLDVRGERPA